MRHPMRIAAATSAAVLILGLTACAGGSGSSPSSEATPELTAAQAKACDAIIAISQDLVDAPQDGPPEPAFVKKVIADFTAIKEGTSGDASAAAGKVIDILDEASQTDNWQLLEDESFFTNWLAAGTPGRSECGFAAVDIEAMDTPAATEGANPEFHFMGVPKTLSPGRTSIRLDNPTETFHEVAVFKVNDDFTGSLEDYKKLDDEGQMKAVTMLGVALTPPQGEGFTNVDLTKGRYFLVCHIPLMDGDGPDAQPKMGPNGPIWHYVLGMAEEVTVN